MILYFFNSKFLDESSVQPNSIPEEPDMVFAENSNNDQSEFDTIVGCIEDIVIGEKFQDLQVQSILNSITRIKDIYQNNV